jgi:phospholipid transport system transporter-binding protein
MDTPHIETLDSCHYHICGELNFASVTALLAASRSHFNSAQGAIDIDLSAVSRADSAGLALLLEWMRMAATAGIDISYHNLPEQLMTIARASNLEQVLPIE